MQKPAGECGPQGTIRIVTEEPGQLTRRRDPGGHRGPLLTAARELSCPSGPEGTSVHGRGTSPAPGLCRHREENALASPREESCGTFQSSPEARGACSPGQHRTREQRVERRGTQGAVPGVPSTGTAWRTWDPSHSLPLWGASGDGGRWSLRNRTQLWGR